MRHTPLQTFQDPGLSDYLVCYVRILTSGYLQANEELYGAFVDGGRTVKEYCSQVRGCVWCVVCGVWLLYRAEYYLKKDQSLPLCSGCSAIGTFLAIVCGSGL